MEIMLAVFSWVLSILGLLLLLSMPVDFLIKYLKKDWNTSKERKVYQIVQMVCLGICIISLIVSVVLMGIPL